MCEIETDGVCEVWETTYRKAVRQTHVCCVCGSTIPKGDAYMRHFGVFEGSSFSEKACCVCGSLWSSFVAAHGGGYSVSYLVGMLQECIADALPWGAAYFDDLGESVAVRAKMRIVDGQWRTYLAIIKQLRRRVGQAAKAVKRADVIARDLSTSADA